MTATVLYDAECPFCRSSMALLLLWDRRRELRPLALQDPRAALLAPELGAGERMESWHLVEEDGSRASSGYAFPGLLRRLPGGRPLAALAERFPHAADRGYRFVSSNRGRLGRVIPSRVLRRADRLIAERSDPDPGPITLGVAPEPQRR